MAKKFSFKDNSEEAIRIMRQASDLGMEKALAVVKSRATALAPVDTGALRGRLTHRVEVSGSEVEGIVGSPHKYAIYVEKGTGEFAVNGMGRKGGWSYQDPSGKWHRTNGQKPQPFLEPAFEQSKEDIKTILGDQYGFSLGKKGGGKK